MAKFAKHCYVRNGLESVAFAPGDEVPEWAVGQVGEHVLDSADNKTAPKKTQAKKTTSGQEDTGKDSDSSNTGNPDFTKPAPAKRRTSRSKA